MMMMINTSLIECNLAIIFSRQQFICFNHVTSALLLLYISVGNPNFLTFQYMTSFLNPATFLLLVLHFFKFFSVTYLLHGAQELLYSKLVSLYQMFIQ